MKVKRKELLAALEAVAPGLAAKEVLEQSDCFVFSDDYVLTFNDELSCSAANPLPGVTGAVKGRKLLDLLKKLDGDVLDVNAADGKLSLKGAAVKGKVERAWVRMEEKVVLEVDAVEESGEWKDLPKGFAEAVAVVSACVGRDESLPQFVCVHMHPKWLESGDNYQFIRYPIKTGLADPLLVRGDSLRHVCGMDARDVSVTGGWVHFRGESVTLSVRRSEDEYFDLTPILEVEGSRVVLPEGLADAVDKAELFSSENVEDNYVLIRMSDEGWMRLEGYGPSGWYARQSEVEYDGEPVKFLVSARVLVELSKRAHECVVGDGKLKVDGKGFVYIACTAAPED